MLNESRILGLQHCNKRKNSVGKRESSIVREYLLAMVDMAAVRIVIKQTFTTMALMEEYHSCDSCKSTKLPNGVITGVKYIEAMATRATAANKHII